MSETSLHSTPRRLKLALYQSFRAALHNSNCNIGMLVVAIDVGIKNLALCAYDFVSNQVIHWDNVNLVPTGRYIPAQNVHYVREFVRRHEFLFLNAQANLIERQMRCNMRIIEAVFHTLYFDKCVIIHAKNAKLHFGPSNIDGVILKWKGCVVSNAGRPAKGGALHKGGTPQPSPRGYSCKPCIILGLGPFLALS